MRAIVCGGRDYEDRVHVHAELCRIDAERGIDEVHQGGARGADRLAKNWALDHGKRHFEHKAQWLKFSKGAGPIRNRQMLMDSKADLVIAFPGGTGTADMVARARRQGVEVIEVAPRAVPLDTAPASA